MSINGQGKLVEFIKGCYEADNREQQVSNFFDSKFELHEVLGDAELITGQLGHLPIEKSIVTSIEDIVKGYQHEKHLYLSVFFLKGTHIDTKKRICAPLFLIPATLKTFDEFESIEIDWNGLSLNKGFFQLIEAVDGDDIESIVQLSELINEGKIDFATASKIERILAERYPTVHTEDMLLYPKLLDEKQLRTTSKNLRIVSGLGLCILRKSPNTISVTKELGSLASKDVLELSEPLQQLLGQPKVSTDAVLSPAKEEEHPRIVVPAALNRAQLKAIANSQTATLSVVIGPPGTGKSYTIASAAIQAVFNDKSVLIASAQNGAVDVVQQKISEAFELPNICIRTGGKGDYKQQLKVHIENLLNGIGIEYVENSEVDLAREDVEEIIEKIDSLELEYAQNAKQANRSGSRLVAKRDAWYSKWVLFQEKRRTQKRKALWKTLLQLESLYPQKNKALKKLIRLGYKQMLGQTVRRQRTQLRTFSKAIRSRTIEKRDERFEKINFDTLKSAFPIWLVNLSEVGQVLPHTKELFDLVIIDEASQCDMATVLPLLQRGKRVVICGDTKQLRHVSFLSRKKARLIADKYGIDEETAERFSFRDRSLLDVTLDAIDEQDHITFLNEHFRSHPQIIGFSNQEFYNGALHLMTEGNVGQKHSAVSLHKVNGKREQGVNLAEAEFIAQKLQELARQQSDLESIYKSTVGILSPFRDQVSLIKEILPESISSIVLKEHRVQIGTAHSFQGEERDIMFLSLCVDDNSHSTSLRHLNRTDVFNVSITRAKEQQHVIYSRNQKDFSGKSVLGRYLNYVASQRTSTQGTENALHDEFSKEVVAQLQLWTIEASLDQNIAGIPFDIVVKHQEKLFGIDLIGYPGAYNDVLELNKIKISKRAGNRVFPIPYNHWLFNRLEVEHDLKVFLGLE